jgi:YD repeat-containing protein
VEDQRGRAITFGYTGDNLTLVTGVNGKTTRYSYSGGGLLISKTLPAGNTPISQTFDSRGRVVRQTDGLGYSATLSYDTPGAGVTTVTGPLNTSFQYTYQGHASLVSQIDPAGQSISFSYDSSNRLVQITDRVGGKKSLPTIPFRAWRPRRPMRSAISHATLTPHRLKQASRFTT